MTPYIMLCQEGIKDTTKMTFPTEMVRLIAKDLNKKDFLEKENKLLYNRVYILEEKISKQDTIIIKKDQIIKNDSIIKLEKDIQLKTKDELNNALKKDLRKSNTEKWFWKVTTFISTGLAIFIAVK